MDEKQKLSLPQQTLSALFSVTNKLQIRGDEYLEELSVRQMMAMIAVLNLPDGSATINNIARKLGTSKQNVKQLITIMERKGCLESVPNERDKRAVNIIITPQGRQMMEVCSGRTVQFLEDIFQDFSSEDLEDLWKLLNKLYHFDGA